MAAMNSNIFPKSEMELYSMLKAADNPTEIAGCLFDYVHHRFYPHALTQIALVH